MLLRKIIGLLFLASAALAGNWVGNQVRAQANGTTPKPIGVMKTNSAGQTVVALNLTLTNFVPALLLGLLAGRPKFIYAFLSGAVISTLVGDAFEQSVVFDLGRRSAP